MNLIIRRFTLNQHAFLIGRRSPFSIHLGPTTDPHASSLGEIFANYCILGRRAHEFFHAPSPVSTRGLGCLVPLFVEVFSIRLRCVTCHSPSALLRDMQFWAPPSAFAAASTSICISRRGQPDRQSSGQQVQSLASPLVAIASHHVVCNQIHQQSRSFIHLRLYAGHRAHRAGPPLPCIPFNQLHRMQHRTLC
jgi:hypothetical protein